MNLTVIVPATNAPATLLRCLDAIAAAAAPPEQLIVVEDPTLTHPALARNAGAISAQGDVLVFIDADVTVHHDVFLRIREALAGDPGLTALFGSYDDTPDAPGVVSTFRNLLHHYVHQQSPGPASTFWAGLGAVRRAAFEAEGGFAVHPIEDIELGIRLNGHGARIVLDPEIQGKHLKDWSLYSMLRTDLLVRGVPWVELLLANRGSASTTTLNLSWRHRLSAVASLTVTLSLALLRPWIALIALITLLGMNFDFYRFLARQQGIARAACGVVLHMLHHLASIAAVPIGIARYLMATRRLVPAKLVVP